MDDPYVKKILTTIILVTLVVLTFILIRPLLLSIFIGMILAFIFNPIYCFILKYIHSKSLAAGLILILFFLLMIIPLILLVPVFLQQSLKIFEFIQQTDLIAPFKTLFPSLFSSPAIEPILKSAVDSFSNKVINSIATALSIDNIINFFFQLTVVFFTFFFFLRDHDQFVSYLQSLLPFPKEIEKKLFDSSKDITYSVLYGHFIIGIIQGLIVGIGFFIFGVPNALVITLLTIFAAILPMVGAALIWIPVVLYLIIAGNTFPAIGVFVFGCLSSVIENLLRPFFVSKRTNLNSSLILIGMIGGVLSIGVLGLIIGPLVIAYLLILLELYRSKKNTGLLIYND